MYKALYKLSIVLARQWEQYLTFLSEERRNVDMQTMTVQEQATVVAGATFNCPLCSFKTNNILAYSAHGWCHIADEVGVGTGRN